MAPSFNPYEGLAMQTTGLNNLSNPTMAAVKREDDISLNSSAKSVIQDKFEVKTIHTRDIIDRRKVSVEQEGYQDLHCTLGSRGSFDTGEILPQWQSKKWQRELGVRERSDGEGGQGGVEAFDNPCEYQKSLLLEKLARLDLLGQANQQTTIAISTADSKRKISPPAPSDTSSGDVTSLVKRKCLGQNSPSKADIIQSKSPIQRRNTSASNQPRRVPFQPVFTRPMNQAARQTKRPKAAQRKPFDNKLVDGGFERGDLAKISNRARQQPNSPADTNEQWKQFQTNDGFNKASQQDLEYSKPKGHIPSGPKNRESRVVGGYELRNKDNILCEISSCTYDAGLTCEIGNAELCDIPYDHRQIILGLKSDGKIVIRFDELLALDDSKDLANVANETSSKVAFRGFIYSTDPDTLPKLTGFKKLLYDNDLVAIARTSAKSSESGEVLTLVCYPTGSQYRSYQLLNKGFSSVNNSLRFAGIYGVLPRALREGKSMTRSLLNIPVRQSRHEESGSVREEALASCYFPWPIPYTPRHGHSFPAVKRPGLQTRDPRLKVSSTHKDQALTSSRIGELSVVPNTAATIQDQSIAAHSNAMDTLPDSSKGLAITTGTITSISNNMDVLSPTPETSNGQYADQITPETHDVQMVDVSNADIVGAKQFEINYKITYDKLTDGTETCGIKDCGINHGIECGCTKTNFFYLWFPEYADRELEVLQRFLDNHDVIVLSNRKQDDWEKFIRCSSGVALFHHSFQNFGGMCGFHELTTRSPFKFWHVSLDTAIPNIKPETHFQEIFRCGTGYL